MRVCCGLISCSCISHQISHYADVRAIYAGPLDNLRSGVRAIVCRSDSADDPCWEACAARYVLDTCYAGLVLKVNFETDFDSVAGHVAVALILVRFYPLINLL